MTARSALLLGALAGACGGVDTIAVRVDLSLDPTTCWTDPLDEALPCAGSAGADVYGSNGFSTYDCRQLGRDADRTADDLPALFASLELAAAPTDEDLQLLIVVYQDEATIGCPNYFPGTPPVPRLYGMSDFGRLDPQRPVFHVTLICEGSAPDPACPAI